MDKSPKNKIEQDTPEKRAFELKRRAFHLVRSFVAKKWEESPESGKKAYFISTIIDGATKLIPEAKTEIMVELNGLYELDEKYDIGNFLDRVTEANIEVMTKYATLEELEKKFSDRSVNERGNQILTRGLHFKIHPKSNQINLHIPVTFFKDANEFLKYFKEGLGILAQKILTDTELKDIKVVVGNSQLVKDKPRLLKSLGFEIILDENGKPTERTKIFREKLLELYGPKSTPPVTLPNQITLLN